MSKKEDKHIKNIIRKIEANKAPSDFTDKVMKDVLMMSSGEESLKSAVLTSVLKRAATERSSQDFTQAVMAQIENQKVMAYKPLISKKGWAIISGTVIAMLIFLFLKDAPNESSSIFDSMLPYLNQTKQVVPNPFKYVRFSPILAISLLTLCSMLFFDTFLKRKIVT